MGNRGKLVKALQILACVLLDYTIPIHPIRFIRFEVQLTEVTGCGAFGHCIRFLRLLERELPG